MMNAIMIIVILSANELKRAKSREERLEVTVARLRDEMSELSTQHDLEIAQARKSRRALGNSTRGGDGGAEADELRADLERAVSFVYYYFSFSI
jgi:hypothetical protein